MQEHGRLGLPFAQTLEGMQNLSCSRIRVFKLCSWQTWLIKMFIFLCFYMFAYFVLFCFTFLKGNKEEKEKEYVTETFTGKFTASFLKAWGGYILQKNQHFLCVSFIICLLVYTNWDIRWESLSLEISTFPLRICWGKRAQGIGG